MRELFLFGSSVDGNEDKAFISDFKLEDIINEEEKEEVLGDVDGKEIKIDVLGDVDDK